MSGVRKKLNDANSFVRSQFVYFQFTCNPGSVWRVAIHERTMIKAAILSGAKPWNEIEDYADSKLEWFQSFLTLPGEIPSHDTFNRVFSALDPEELEKGFVAWVSSIAKLTAGEVVATDGKALRGSLRAGQESHRAYGFGLGRQQQFSVGAAPGG